MGAAATRYQAPRHWAPAEGAVGVEHAGVAATRARASPAVWDPTAIESSEWAPAIRKPYLLSNYCATLRIHCVAISARLWHKPVTQASMHRFGALTLAQDPCPSHQAAVADP